MNRNHRLLAVLLCAGIILFLLTSSAYIFLEAHHDCDGDDCEICEQIIRLEALLQSMARLWVLLAAGFCLLLRFRYTFKGINTGQACIFTLVRYKIRLNN